jgi:hypothetical protein
MMLAFDLHIALLHDQHHFRAQVMRGVRRRARKVTFAVAKLVAEVGALVPPRVPFALAAIHVVIRRMRGLIEADVVENKELQFGADVGGVGDPGRLHVVDRLASDIARIASVILLGERILDIANHRQCDFAAKWIEKRGLRHWQHQHVRLIDRFPTMDAGTVEPAAVFEVEFLEAFGGDGEMFPEARKIHEAQIHGLHIFFANESQDFFRSHC